jgi:putative aldouronate transport system substrate-binding protein
LASEPQDKWEQFKKFNDSAVKSELFGFKPETSGYEKEISDITALMDTYGPALSTGSVDPEVYLPRLNEDLKKAGIEELKEELQRQINAWLQKKKM